MLLWIVSVRNSSFVPCKTNRGIMLFFVYDAVLRSKTAFLYTLYPVSLTGTALCNAAFTYIYITYLPYGAEMKDTKFIGVLFFYEREDFIL